MSKEELAAYDAGKPLPPESSRISRSNRLTTYSPKVAEHQPDSVNGDGTFHVKAAEDTDSQLRVPLPANGVDEELRAYYRTCLESLDAFASVAANCVLCGKHLKGDTNESRVTILLHEAKDNDSCRTFCKPCYDGLELKLDTPSDEFWKNMDQQSLDIWTYYCENLPQAEIAKRLGVNQSTVSRVVARIQTGLKQARNAN